MTSSPLVSTDWLSKNLYGPDVVIIDASIFMVQVEDGRGEFRSGLETFANEGRIPGSRYADLFTEFSDASSPYPFTRPGSDQFRKAAERIGVGARSHVVIYDRLIGQWAARLWWVFRSHGHERVSVLDGGFRKYASEGREIETGELQPFAYSDYVLGLSPDNVATSVDVSSVVDGIMEADLICLLPADDFNGTVSVRERPGHIPGSKNLPFHKLIDTSENTFRNPQEIRSLISAVSPLDGRMVITYCGAGIASTMGALALASIGYTATKKYDGSLVEWVSDPSRSVTITPVD